MDKWISKDNCKHCGHAWQANDYISGYWICPKCKAVETIILIRRIGYEHF